MNKLRLLIVDDSEDNRLVLKTICKKLEGFEIKDAVDGIDAVAMAESWQPHIILMDIMMPQLDGFEASRIIKAKHPEIVIIAVTAVSDSRVQENMKTIGVEIYLHKPVDRELIRYKLESIGSAIRSKLGTMKNPSPKKAHNPFNSDIRSFKTFFEITDTEAMMDFGMWLFDQYNGKASIASNKFDTVLNLFYKLMSQGNKNSQGMNIIIEESYEEFYIMIKFDSKLNLESKILENLNLLGTECILQEDVVYVKLSKPTEITKKELPKQQQELFVMLKEIELPQIAQKEQEELRLLQEEKKQLLHQTFVHKTSAVNYVDEIGGNVIDEILDLSSVDEEWFTQLEIIEKTSSEESILYFTDTVLRIYVKAINNLFEFTALAYALSSLAVFIKESASKLSQDTAQLHLLVMFLEHLGTDLSSWREHVFILQDTENIHYLDSSFFSSCIQIEEVINNKHSYVDDDIEFF